MENTKSLPTVLSLKKISLPSSVDGVLIFSLIYWAYLIATSQMTISHDALGYERLGEILSQKGWLHFFKTGPQREPMYPLLISLSMQLANILHISYKVIVSVAQCLILFITQLLMLRLLKHIGISNAIKASAVCYIGVSPALVNSALSLYSEIVTYPFVLGITLSVNQLWKGIQQNSFKKSFIWSIALGVLFAFITLAKALFEFIFIAFIIFFFTFCLYFASKNNKKSITNVLISASAVLISFYLLIFPYKYVNQYYNHQFTVANRGPFVLYGNIMRRTENMPLKKYVTALAYVPGEGFCKKFFSKEDCFFWSFYTSDKYSFAEAARLHNTMGLFSYEIDDTLIKESFQRFLNYPAQYLIFTFIEALKIFFWESTQVGYVNYPDWLNKLYSFVLFKNTLRLLTSILTILGILYCLQLIIKKRKELFKTDDAESQKLQLFLFIALFIFAFAAFYSFFFILTRYALPIAPLYLSCIAFALQKTLAEKSRPT